MNSGVYEILNTTNGKRYVGSAVRFETRWGLHKNGLDRGDHANSKLQRAWNKYGRAAFSFKRILVCAPKNLLFYEQRCLDALLPEYNISKVAGSNFGNRWSEASRDKMRGNKNTLGYKHTPEALEKMAALGRARTLSQETRDKISAARKGLKLSAEHKAKISAHLIGNKFAANPSAERRAQLSAAMIGNQRARKK